MGEVLHRAKQKPDAPDAHLNCADGSEFRFANEHVRHYGRIRRALVFGGTSSSRVKQNAITEESVTRAIEEERSKLTMGSGGASASTSDMRKVSEESSQANAEQKIKANSKLRHDDRDTAETERKIRDLEIKSRAKDYIIEQLERERHSFSDERQKYISNLMSFSRKVGEPGTQLRQLGALTRQNELPQGSELVRDEEVWKNSEGMNV